MKQQKTIKELLEFSILNVDKPCNPTSFDVSDFVRNKLNLRKTSHFGTLDPKVTGVLPIALNRACKLTGYFLKKNKTYIGVMNLHEDISLLDLKKGIKKFTGKIIQKPPVRSRVKREKREREIFKFEILEKNGREVLFEVHCEAGTYIRKLVHDLGEKLGVKAHMTELRRISAGIFSEQGKEFVNLYDFEKAVQEYEKGNEKKIRDILIPAEKAISEVFKVVQIKEQYVSKLQHGSLLFSEFLLKKQDKNKNEKIAVFCKNLFIGIFNVLNEEKIFAKPEFVLQPL